MTTVKVVSLKDVNEKGRVDWAKPIRQYETPREPWEFRCSGFMGKVDRRTLPKIKGMEFKFIETKVNYKSKKVTVYLTYA